MSVGSHSGSFNHASESNSHIHIDCKNLDQKEHINDKNGIMKRQCLKIFKEQRIFWFFCWHSDLIFTMKDRDDVLLVSFHQDGVDRLLCSKSQYVKKRNTVYDPQKREQFYDYEQTPELFMKIEDCWGMMEDISKNYNFIFNNCQHKANELIYNFYLKALPLETRNHVRINKKRLNILKFTSTFNKVHIRFLIFKTFILIYFIIEFEKLDLYNILTLLCYRKNILQILIEFDKKLKLNIHHYQYNNEFRKPFRSWCSQRLHKPRPSKIQNQKRRNFRNAMPINRYGVQTTLVVYMAPRFGFQIKEKPDVVIVSYHENGVDRLLCSKNQFEEKKQNLYDSSKRIPIYNLDETPNTFLCMRDLWEKIEIIGCNDKNKYDILWNNYHDKAKQFNFYLQQKLANQLELQINLLCRLQIVIKKKK